MGLFGTNSVTEVLSGYHYTRLNQQEQEIYTKVAEGIAAMQKKITFTYSGSEDIQKILKAVEKDNPQFFYLDKSAIQMAGIGKNASITPPYLYDKKTAEMLYEKLNAAADKLLAGIIKEGMNDFEKVTAVHDYLTGNVMYNFSALVSKIAFDAHSIEGPLLKRCAVCEGIAKTFAWLMTKLEIPVLCVSGASVIDGQKGNHMWNMVGLDGTYYHLDATWDLQEVNHFSSQSHAYVLLDDDAMLELHEWDVNEYPTCDCLDWNYYVVCGRYFKTRRVFELFLQKSMEERKSFIDVRFSDIMSLPDTQGQWAVDVIRAIAGRLGISVGVSCGYVEENCILLLNLTYM